MNTKNPAPYEVKCTGKMSSTQSKITSRANKQENTTHIEKKNQSIYTNLEMTQRIELVDIKTVIGTVVHMIKKAEEGASLVAQWLRVCLPMQGTRVRALVWEDPACRRATGPVSHNCWACASGACAPQEERPRQWEARALRWRVAPTRRN